MKWAWQLLGVVIFLFSPSVSAGEWIQWGGPSGDFQITSGKLAERWPEGGPATLWKRPLGDGYSSILYQDGRLYTMYRDDTHEVVVALDAATGKTEWEHRYEAPVWPEMTPAFGLGPNATPIIVGDRLVSIGIGGQLRALTLETGRLLWQHDLPAEYGRRERDEEYGYSASPLEYGGKIIVQVGGTDHAVVAFDPVEGAPVWKSPPGGVSYAQASLTTLAGRDQFLYFSPLGLVSLDPSTGDLLWDSPMEYNNGNHLTPIVKCDETHVWVGSQFTTGGGRLLEIVQEGKTWSARRIWFETYLRASHWTSIRIGDYIYGSIGGNSVSVLTAFDWRTGKIAWRQRGFHKAQALYADGKLLFLDESGQLVIARVSPEKLEVLDRAQVTESISWTLPTLVDSRLYLRDQTHILALDLAEGGDGARAGRDPVPGEVVTLQGAFGEFIRQLEAAEATKKKTMIDDFFAQQESFPIVEDDSLVHFVFRGDVPDIVVAGNFMNMRESEPLHRVPDTDLYFRSFQLSPGSHFEYRFGVFDDSLSDPLNPRSLGDPEQPPSVFNTPGWVEPLHLSEPQGTRGVLEKLQWDSAILQNERELTVYLPPAYEASEQRYPVVMVNYGNQALDPGLWGHSLDNLIGRSIEPLIAVFVPRVSFEEYGPNVEQFAQAIAEELLPQLDTRYRTRTEAGDRAMAGIASGGFAAVFLALARPDVIGNAAVQSFYFREEAEEKLRSMIASDEAAATTFYVEWSVNDLANPPNLTCEQDSRELAKLLETKGYRLFANEVTDGAGWGSWRARNDLILETFFALEGQ